MTKPYNISLHVSLNVATDCRVKLDLSDVVNSNIHVSYTAARGGAVEAVIDRAFNSSIHLRCNLIDWQGRTWR